MTEEFLPLLLSLAYFAPATVDLYYPSFALMEMKIDEDSLLCFLLPPVVPTLLAADCFFELPEPPALSATLHVILFLLPETLFWQL